MARQTILITGGAGFVGSNLALGLKQQYSSTRILALDNLKRRGSELNLSRLKVGASNSYMAIFGSPPISTK